MKTKLILAAILATAVVTALTAIHTSPASGQESGRNRAKLRPQLAALRAEVELLEIEHDALAETLKESMTESMKFEIKNTGMESLLNQLPDLVPSRKAVLSDEDRQGAKEDLNTVKAINRGMDARIRDLKEQFHRLCGKLNEKRLDLDDLESLYAKSK